MTTPPFQRIANYSLVEELHRGERSLVVRARRDGTNQAVVLKMLAGEYPAHGDIARLEQEYQIGRGLQSSAVMRYHDRLVHGNSAVLVVEDFEAESLARVLERRHIDLELALRITMQAAQGLADLHAHHVIHKDISPGNILVNEQTGVVKLCDFGISSIIDRQQQQAINPELLEGTLAYISPEQTGRMNRAIDYRTDLYSLGAVLYHLLAGHPPFENVDALGLVHAHIAREPDPLAVPHPVARIVKRLMAKNAEERYQSAGSCARDLERCLTQLTTAGSISDFELTRENTGVLNISQRLYGRADDVEALMAAFERVTTSKAELLTVSGYSGIGKTSLIYEVHKPMVARRGYFMFGKFDQLNVSLPFSAIIQALSQHVRMLLTKTEARLAYWRARLLTAFEGNGQLVLDILPELALIVGPQPAVVELPSAQAKQRFENILQRLVRAFADPQHPLVLVIDDCQWIDPVSARFLSLLMTHPDTQHLLLICAYRDNEVTPAHPLMLTLRDLREHGVTINDIVLSPLDSDDITAFLADSLALESEAVAPLAELLRIKTDGNPFFLTQYLRTLYDERRLRFDSKQSRWLWELDELLGLEVASNVVDLMVSRIRRYDDETQDLLRLASYLGNTFNLEALSIIAARPELEVAKGLWPAIKDGLLIPLDSNYQYFQWVSGSGREAPSPKDVRYRFAHDRIQEAAHSQVTADQRPSLALTIGRRLLANIPASALPERVFDVVNHLNAGIALIEDPEERHRLAELNLLAGQRAKAATAYAAAVEHLEHGVRLLPADAWERHGQLSFALHRELVECAYLAGDSERAQEVFERTAVKVTAQQNVGDLYQVMLRILQTASRNLEATRLGQKVLREHFGIDIPDDPAEADAFIAAEDQKIAALTAGRELMDFVNAPTMHDEAIAMCIGLLYEIWSAAQFDGNYKLVTMTSQKMTALALEHGVSDFAPGGYIAYGQVLSNRDNYELADAYGSMAVELAQKLNNPLVIAKVNNSYNNYINPYRHHLATAVPIYEESYRNCLLSGDMWWGSWALGWIRLSKFILGAPLDDVYERAMMYHDYIKNSGYVPLLWMSLCERHVFMNLRGDTPSLTQFHSDEFDEAGILTNMRAGFGFGVAWYLLYKSFALYVHGCIDEALEASREADSLRELIRLVIFYPDFFFIGSLVSAAAYERSDAEQRELLLAKLHENRDRMKMWADNCPENFAHRHRLICAEIARITADHAQVLDHYEAAIEHARANGYLHHEAIANELAGRYCLSRGWIKPARAYLTEAHYLFARWGATRKLELLSNELGVLLGWTASSETSQSSPSIMRRDDTTTRVQLQELELTTVLKATRAITEEIQLGRLIHRMMTIALENAGAVRAVLLFQQEGDLAVVASAELAKQVEIHRPALPLEEFEQLPKQVIYFVQRTGETVALDDATTDTQFHNDPYIVERNVHSILCLPAVRTNERSIVLYLENIVTRGVFTHARVNLQKVLFAQAAISLENAILYDTLERKVDARTKELREKNDELALALKRLREAQDRMIVQDRLAALGTLTAGISHELRNPLNFVINFAELAIGLGEELKDKLGELEGTLDADTSTELLGVVDELNPYLEMIGSHGRRAEEIIRSMLAHSRGGNDEFEDVELNALITEYVNLTYRGLKAGNADFDVSITTELDAETGIVRGLPTELGRVIINLLQNACHAVGLRGKQGEAGYAPTIVVSSHNLGDAVEVRVRDNGVGVSPDIRDKIFTPFFTTKRGTEGSGLGLSLSHEIVVKGHGGRIDVDSVVGEYAQFTVLIPRTHTSS